MSATDEIRKWQALRDEDAELKARRAAIKDELDRLGPDVILAMAEEGLQNARVNGKTVYTQTTVRAHVLVEDTDRLEVELNSIGETLAVTRINANTLTSWVRQRRELGEELPEAVAQFITVTEIPELRQRA